MSSPVAVASRPTLRLGKMIVLSALFITAVVFIGMYPVHYFLHYAPSGFGPYWPRRYGLLLHITGGMVALFIGPWQFSQRLRQRNLQLHRVMGRTYLIAILLGSIGGAYMAVTTTFGWAWGLGLIALDAAWLTTSGMAFYLIKQGRVQPHREWMIRSYIVTFGFVTFRILNDFGPTSRLKPASEAAITWVWLCWTIPLLVAEVVLELRRTRR